MDARRLALCLGTAGYIYDKTTNDFFLSTTSLHDGKGGFTSDNRLNEANKKAEECHQRYHSSGPREQRFNQSINPFRLCGNNYFVSMINYRAATKVHVKHLVNTRQAHDSILKNIKCLKGDLIKIEAVAKYHLTQVPKDFNLTNSPQYTKKNKNALVGVPNDETGSIGYTSRSITKPFPEKGLKHFIDATQSESALTPKRCMESLEALLQDDEGLNGDAQLAAGQVFLNFRRVYCNDENWGDARKIVLKTLIAQGWVSEQEVEKIMSSRPFQKDDLAKSLFKRNTSIAGPPLYHTNIYLQERVFIAVS